MSVGEIEQFMHPICSILLAALCGMTRKSWHY